MLVWDVNSPWPEGQDNIVLWNKYTTKANPHVFSLPEMVEKDAYKFRRIYLAWIHDLGNTEINGRRLVDNLKLRPGFSYWWMSSLAQKSNISKGSLINDAIKVLALESLINEQKLKSLALVSSNKRLADCLCLMCQNLGVQFEWRTVSGFKRKYNLKTFYKGLPSLARAGIYLFWYLFRAVPILFKKKPIKNFSAGQLTLVDIFVYLNESSMLNGRFSSHYWGSLTQKMSEWGVKTNWIHNYFRHSLLGTPSAAIGLTQKFSASSNGAQFHVLVEQYLSLASLYKAIRDYLSIRRNFNRLKVFPRFQTKSDKGFLWPLHVDEWHESLCGKEAIKNCITLSLMERVVGNLPHQEIGIYVQENQPWEMALNYAWRASGHGLLIGAQLGTVRFWDLRCFYDERTFLNSEILSLPFPDAVAVNGPVAKKNLQVSGYPDNKLREVEALRYLHLNTPLIRKYHGESAKKSKRVLICGDYLIETTRQMLSLLNAAEAASPTTNNYVFKPHPACSMDLGGYPKVEMIISKDPIRDLLAACDLVFASNHTSASVDAYCLGVPIIQMQIEGELNFSPLRGLPDTMFIKNANELAYELKKTRDVKLESVQDYFYLNESLVRWKKMIDPKL